MLEGRSTKEFEKVQKLPQNKKIKFILDALESDKKASFMEHIKRQRPVNIDATEDSSYLEQHCKKEKNSTQITKAITTIQSIIRVYLAKKITKSNRSTIQKR